MRWLVFPGSGWWFTISWHIPKKPLHVWVGWPPRLANETIEPWNLFTDQTRKKTPESATLENSQELLPQKLMAWNLKMMGFVKAAIFRFQLLIFGARNFWFTPKSKFGNALHWLKLTVDTWKWMVWGPYFRFGKIGLFSGVDVKLLVSARGKLNKSTSSLTPNKNPRIYYKMGPYQL